ncbi:MAG: hypothetical protein WCA11_10655 [Terracidiphilus sp.]
MKFDVKALALAWAIVWGGAILLVGLANLMWGGYGQRFLEMLSSWYPGYSATRSIGQVAIVTLYGIADGFFGGALFGWIYNSFAKSSA